MKSFGNYLELDLRSGKHYHENAIKLNSAKNCLRYILKAKKYKKIIIPYYTCKDILDIVNSINIEHEFYSINEFFEPVKINKLSSGEAFLYTNYYGLKSKTVENLSKIYQSQLIIDNALAFYEKPVSGIDTFYSARKFFGVPDGAYLYTDTILKEDIEQDRLSYSRMIHLLKRIDVSIEESHTDFLINEQNLDEQPLMKMSKLTEKLLMGIDYETIKNKRIENYYYLNSALKNENMLKIACPKDAVPMIYPFINNKIALREKLAKNKIYATTFWTNIFDWCNRDQTEYLLANHTMPLPIDQKYSMEDMKKITEIVLQLIK